jgi:hypothetical protein
MDSTDAVAASEPVQLRDVDHLSRYAAPINQGGDVVAAFAEELVDYVGKLLDHRAACVP